MEDADTEFVVVKDNEDNHEHEDKESNFLDSPNYNQHYFIVHKSNSLTIPMFKTNAYLKKRKTPKEELMGKMLKIT